MGSAGHRFTGHRSHTEFRSLRRAPTGAWLTSAEPPTDEAKSSIDGLSTMLVFTLLVVMASNLLAMASNLVASGNN